MASTVAANRLELLQIADAVARDKSIDKAVVLTAMEEAMQRAAKAHYGTENDIKEFLKGTYEALSDVLQKMEGKIEFGLKVNWDKDQVIKEIESENEEIRRLKEEIQSNTSTSTYFSRMQLGRVVESALQAKADAYLTEIYEALREAAIASRSNKPIGDKMIMNAAFLVERDKTKAFDDQISDIAKKYENKLSFLYTGPWPPYNFVNIRLKLERGSGQ